MELIRLKSLIIQIDVTFVYLGNKACMQSEASAPLYERPALRKFAVKGFSGKQLSCDSVNDVQDLEPLLVQDLEPLSALSDCPADGGV